MSALANYPKHLARRLAIRQRLDAERQIERLTEGIAYARERGWLDHVYNLAEMRDDILADIEAGMYWPHGRVIEEGGDGMGTHARAAA